MRKWVLLILAACLPLLSSCAAADQNQFCDEIPPGVRELAEQYAPGEEYMDCILFKDTPLGEYCLIQFTWSLDGYLFEDGEWKMRAQTHLLPQDADLQPYFRRHAAGAAPGIQGACGLTYPDSLGFDVIKSNPGDQDDVVMMMQFHWAEGTFRLVGWQSGAAGQFAVWEDGLWAFFDSTRGGRLGAARLDRLAEYGLAARFEDLPLTLAQARKMETITQATAETLFPGWTLGFYEEYNMGHAAAAGYYRVEDGLLTIRRASLSIEAEGIRAQTDTMPVPLSEALLLRLKTEDAETLLDTSGYSSTFLTDDAFDTEKIPVTDTVLQSDLQANGLMLLTEDADGLCRLRWVEPGGAGYAVRSSQPLPDAARLDLFHYSDGEIGLKWGDQYSSCSFTRSADGNWTLHSTENYDGSYTLYGTLYCGILNDSIQNGTNSILVGSHPWSELFSIDFSTLPKSIEEAAAALNRDGWAVVNNPDPADRLHLRAEPDTASESLGKFYNRTPVQVLSQRGGWSRVRIGLDGRLEAWMMTKYLAFGSGMDAVGSASPDLTLREGKGTRPLYASPEMLETTGIPYGNATWIVGVVGDELYILLDSDGNTGYLPQSLFFAGYG